MQYNDSQALKAQNSFDEKPKNIVVIFSWGVKEDELYKLPDKENIIFLLHPSQEAFSQPSPFKKSQIIKSTIEATKKIIENAKYVFGDMSSLTFEVARFAQTYYFLDRVFYIDNYDVEDNYITINSEKYGEIPETNLFIPMEFILNKCDLACCRFHGQQVKLA